MNNNMSPENSKIFDLLFNAGEALLRSGASAASTTKTLLAICAKAGMENVSVSITVGQLTVSYQPTSNSFPISRMHNIAPGVLDIWWRTRAEDTIEQYLMGDLEIEEANLALQQYYERNKYRTLGGPPRATEF